MQTQPLSVSFWNVVSFWNDSYSMERSATMFHIGTFTNYVSICNVRGWAGNGRHDGGK